MSPSLRLSPLAIAILLGSTSAAHGREPARRTRADDPLPDTSYGRVDGDLSLVVGAGVTVAPRAPRLAADLRLRYLDTLGVFAGYEDGASVGLASDPRRLLDFGLELRPLFLGRWLRGYEWGSPRADLTLDSLGLEIGGFFAQPTGAAFGSRPGLQLGLGLETPVFPRASGPWIGLHGGVRFSDAALSGAALDGPSDRSLYLAITVSWHVFFGGHVVDVGDTAPR